MARKPRSADVRRVTRLTDLETLPIPATTFESYWHLGFSPLARFELLVSWEKKWDPVSQIWRRKKKKMDVGEFCRWMENGKKGLSKKKKNFPETKSFCVKTKISASVGASKCCRKEKLVIQWIFDFRLNENSVQPSLDLMLW